jgi:hypothetical protein
MNPDSDKRVPNATRARWKLSWWSGSTPIVDIAHGCRLCEWLRIIRVSTKEYPNRHGAEPPAHRRAQGAVRLIRLTSSQASGGRRLRHHARRWRRWPGDGGAGGKSLGPVGAAISQSSCHNFFVRKEFESGSEFKIGRGEGVTSTVQPFVQTLLSPQRLRRPTCRLSNSLPASLCSRRFRYRPGCIWRQMPIQPGEE